MRIDRRSFLERMAIGLLFSTGGSPAFAQGYKPKPEVFRLNKKWLRNDVAGSANTSQILSEAPRELRQLLDRFSPYGVSQDRSIGFGLRQLHLAKGCGYTSVLMNVIAKDQRILALECVQTAEVNDWPHISSEILKGWNRAPFTDPEPLEILPIIR